jgi:hypothetical protein
MKRIATTIAIIPAVLAFTGCATSEKLDLPNITAKEVWVSHQNPLFNVNLQADNLVDHGDRVTADRITYERGGRITSTTIRVEGYRRNKQPAEAAQAVSAPAQIATPPPFTK